jgi:electron transport complex protein RnfG
MGEILKLGAKLLLICLVSASLLAVTNEATKGPIQAQRDAASHTARQEVLSDADAFEPLEGEEFDALVAENPAILEVFTGTAGGEMVGYVIKTAPVGFGGPVEVITGMSLDGKLTGVRIGAQNETPGLGAIIATEGFYGQYQGMVTDEVTVSKTEKTDTAIKAIAGATISSRAVTDGVNESINAYKTLAN